MFRMISTKKLRKMQEVIVFADKRYMDNQEHIRHLRMDKEFLERRLRTQTTVVVNEDDFGEDLRVMAEIACQPIRLQHAIPRGIVMSRPELITRLATEVATRFKRELGQAIYEEVYHKIERKLKEYGSSK